MLRKTGVLNHYTLETFRKTHMTVCKNASLMSYMQKTCFCHVTSHEIIIFVRYKWRPLAYGHAYGMHLC